MTIEIPRIWREIVLREYAPEFGEGTVAVWVNPPRSMLTAFQELANEFNKEKAEKSVEMIAELWNVPVEQVRELMDESSERDPLFFTWLIFRTFSLIREHRNILKKNWMVESST